MAAPYRLQPGTEWIARDAVAVGRATQARRDAMATDLFLPADARLRDDDRATIARLLHGIVDGIDQTMRRHLVGLLADRPTLAQRLGGTMPLARPILERAGALRDPALVAALAQRTAEGRIVARLRHARERMRGLDPMPPRAPLDELVASAGGTVAALASRLLRAGRKRWDAAGGPVAATAELPADRQHALVWQVAAALRRHLSDGRAGEPAAIDPAVAGAAAATLAGYDEGETLPGMAQALAQAMHATDGLTDGLIVGALASAEPGFVAAALAVRAGVDFATAWSMMLDPADLFLLCRAAGLLPATAVDLALRLGTEGDDDAVADRLEACATLTPQYAVAALALWRIDPAYREAVVALSRAALSGQVG